MKANVLNRIVGVTCVAAAFLLSACGDDDKESTCPEGQALVSVDGAAICAAECNAGVCGAGQVCNQNYCVPAANVNNSNNTNNPPNNTNNPPNNTNNPPNNTNNNPPNNSNNNPPNNTNNNPPNNPTCTPSTIPGACDIVCQTGCQAGQACILSGGTPEAPQAGCVTAGTGVEGDVCMGPCSPGFQCVPESQGAASGICRKFCGSADGPQCTAPSTCAPLVQDLSAGICAVPEDACTQYPNDSCPDGQNCYATQLGLQCVAYKADANAGDVCTSPTQCNDDQACAGAQGAANNTCQNKCEPANPQCAQGEQCVGLTINGQPSGYGVCATM